jgi:hypothetical protein
MTVFFFCFVFLFCIGRGFAMGGDPHQRNPTRMSKRAPTFEVNFDCEQAGRLDF